MKRYVVSPLAKSDLAEIWLYIARDNLSAAVRIRAALERKFRQLAANPKMGELRPEFGSEYRTVTVSRYVIFHRPISGGVEIVRVLHGARDIDTILGTRP